jgi:menaquinone-dependent protoporphyrinogen oxidase
MQELLLENGHEVTVADAIDEPPAPNAFDAVLIGVSCYIHKYQATMAYYITDHLNM